MFNLRGLLFLTFAFALLGSGLAFADSGAAAASPWTQWYPILGGVLGLVAAPIRNYTPVAGFWHQWYGHLALMMIGALLGSLAPMFTAGVVTKATLAGAIGGALSAFGAALKTGGVSNAAAKLSAMLPLILLPFVLSGCPSSAAGQATIKCELGQLPAAEQSILVEVEAIATNAASTIQDLEALAAQLGPGQVGCAVQALLTWIGSSQPAGARMLVAAADPIRQHAHDVLAGYLQKHPASSCTAVHISAATWRRGIDVMMARETLRQTVALTSILSRL